MKKLINSFKFAICGIKSGLKSEINLKIHFVIMILVIIAGYVFEISSIEWMICIILFGLVISAELMNTAIEEVTNIAMPKKDDRAKFAKDTAAGAVLVMAIIAAIIGFIIFVPKIVIFFKVLIP